MTAFADLAQATAWVFDLQKFGIKFGLSSTLSLLDRLGLDYQAGRYIHIAGTNGKGSVAAMLSAILSRAGYPVGMFTSPHLVSFKERYRLGDQEVSADRLLALINEVRAAVDDAEPPTFFEFATAMAFLYFLQAGAAPIILETGMGGRLDATNIVQPLVSVITNISRDHQEHLGEGLLAIAGEKAGIIKPGAPLVTYARQKQVLQLFRSRCQEAGAPLYQGGMDFKTRGKSRGSFDYFGLQQPYPRPDPQPQGPAPVRQCRGGPGGGGTAQPGRFPRVRDGYPGGLGDSRAGRAAWSRSPRTPGSCWTGPTTPRPP